MLCSILGEAVESSSQFATYVAFGLFSTVIFVFTIGHALFLGAISYLAGALKTVDIFLDYFLVINVSLTHFFAGRRFSNHQTNKSISQLGALRSGCGHGRVIRFFREFFIPDRSAVILGFPLESIEKINSFGWDDRSLVCRGLT